ncbi:MAG: hypothetical protein IPO94_05435 [Saprospiraceae bacterium]|nr:hypothetical protein [Saprospiraceae bacterium]
MQRFIKEINWTNTSLIQMILKWLKTGRRAIYLTDRSYQLGAWEEEN